VKPFGLSPHLSFLAQLGPRLLFRPHDLVIEEFMPPVGFCLMPLWTSKPVISIVQWYFFESWEEKYRLPLKSIMKRLAALGLYKYVIVQTDAMGREMNRYLNNAVIQKIPCGINKSDFIPTPSYDDFVMFLGRLDEYQKGLDMLVGIWKKVSMVDRIPLVIAGDGPCREALEKQFAQAGIRNLVTFVGRISGDEKKKFLGTCRFLVMPSREETFGITALEAMAASKPVIIYNIDNLNEVVTPEWGEVVNRFDLSHFAKKTIDLWQNTFYCKEKGVKGRDVANAYLWDNIAEQQNEFYQKVLSMEKGHHN